MPTIRIETKIKSKIEICFDLSRSIDLHQISTAKSNEKAIDGITTGLISVGEFVTWQAIHFGIKQNLTSKITQFRRPYHFRDEQMKGAFKYIIHDHNFGQMLPGSLASWFNIVHQTSYPQHFFQFRIPRFANR